MGLKLLVLAMVFFRCLFLPSFFLIGIIHMFNIYIYIYVHIFAMLFLSNFFPNDTNLFQRIQRWVFGDIIGDHINTCFHKTIYIYVYHHISIFRDTASCCFIKVVILLCQEPHEKKYQIITQKIYQT